MSSDFEYYYLRAEAELEMAQRSNITAAVKAHYTLACYYLDHVYKVDGDDQSELTRLLCKEERVSGLAL